VIGAGSLLAGLARALDEARWYASLLNARFDLACWHLRRVVDLARRLVPDYQAGEGAPASEVATALRRVGVPADTRGNDAWTALVAAWRQGRAA
jgi:hypothetical protein